MFDDGDDILNAVGVVLAVLLVLGLGVTFLAASTANERSGSAPDAKFRFAAANDSQVFVEKVGGKPLDASNVVVAVDGTQRQVTWNDTVSNGDRVYVTARSGSVIRVYWDPGEGERTLLARYRVD